MLMDMAVEDSSWKSSYIYSVDNETDWGGRYFFTYFSEFNERSANIIAIEVAVFATIFLVSVVANVSIIVCVLRFSDMRTVTNCFVLNLAAADLLFAFSIPAVAYTRIVAHWQFGDLACRLVPYIQFVSGIVLLWTLALISIDRYRCIVIPPYRSKISPRQATLCSALIWLATTIIFIPVPLWFRQLTSTDAHRICTLIFPKSDTIHLSALFVVLVVLFACLLPMLLLVYHYQRIFNKILSLKTTWSTTTCVVAPSGDDSIINQCTNNNQRSLQTRRQSELSISDIFVPWPRRFSSPAAGMQGGCASSNGRHGSLLSQHEALRLNKHIKVVRVLFLNVIVVLVMWLPITVIMLLIYIDGKRPTDDQNFFLRSHHFIWTLIVALLNTLVNPLLYGVLSDNFRACLARIWCKDRKLLGVVVVKDTVTPSSGRQNGGGGGAPPSKSIIIQPKPNLINSISENQNNGVVTKMTNNVI